MVKTNQFEYLKKVVNVMTYINFSQISCMTFKLLSKLKDIKRFAKSSDRYFLYARIYRVFPLLIRRIRPRTGLKFLRSKSLKPNLKPGTTWLCLHAFCS